MLSQEKVIDDRDGWFLLADELSLLPGMIDTGRLGFALQLKFRQVQGYYPDSVHDFPSGIVYTIAEQVGCASVSPENYPFQGRQAQRHRQHIRRYLGVRLPSKVDIARLSAWLTEAACMAHARRKIHDVHARIPTDLTTEALKRIGEFYAIEAEIRGSLADERMTVRKTRTVPLMQSLYDWIQEQMTVLSRHSNTAKAFAYQLKQWGALNLYCSNGWVEIDNNIAENALRGVALGRKNWLFAGSESGGERPAILYSLIGTCWLNGVDPEAWLRYVIGHIQDWPVNRGRDLLPWKVGLSSV